MTAPVPPLSPERHEQIAHELDFIADSLLWRSLPFRDRAEQHREVARAMQQREASS